MGIQPGALSMLIHRSSDPYYNYWTSAGVELTAEETNGVHYASTDIPQTRRRDLRRRGHDLARLRDPRLGRDLLLDATRAPSFAVAGIGISPGVAYPTTLRSTRADAQAVWIERLGLRQARHGDVARVRALPRRLDQQGPWTGHPGPGRRRRSHSVPLTMTGAKVPQVKKVTIPSTVKPGYAYNFTVAHTDGPLELTTWFQTCYARAEQDHHQPRRRGAAERGHPHRGAPGLDAGQGQVRRDLQAHHERGAAPLLGRDEVGVDQGGRRQGGRLRQVPQRRSFTRRAAPGTSCAIPATTSTGARSPRCARSPCADTQLTARPARSAGQREAGRRDRGSRRPAFLRDRRIRAVHPPTPSGVSGQQGSCILSRWRVGRPLAGSHDRRRSSTHTSVRLILISTSISFRDLQD